MDINLKRDICFFDLESTGLNVVRDRIVQIAVIKHHADGKPAEELSMLINPGMVLMSEEAMAVHGITPKMLANKPTFQQVAQKIYDFIGDSDLAGYNSNRFDVPMLMEEFARVGIEFSLEGRRTIDVQRIFFKMEPRNLRAALRFYTGKEIENAHDALADVQATIDVFSGQLEKYKGVDFVDDDGNVTKIPVRPDIQSLHDFTNDTRFLDATQRFRIDQNGIPVFNFGKYVGKPVAETLAKDQQYYGWIQAKEFSSQVKQLAKQLVKEYKAGNK